MSSQAMTIPTFPCVEMPVAFWKVLMTTDRWQNTARTERFSSFAVSVRQTVTLTHYTKDMNMADLPPYSTPRWVKILGIVALVLVLLLGILHLSGFGGNHGP